MNFTRNGLRLGSRHQELHRRVKEFGYSCHQRRLTWAKEKKNWTVAQWSKVLFSDESKFCISFGNQGPRVWRKGGEAHSPSCLKSSVKFTFMHLADAFIQSDLQCIQVIHLLSVSWELNPQPFVLLTQCSNH